MHSYKFTLKGALDKIITPVILDASDYDTSSSAEGTVENVNALWDTGATVSVLSTDMVRRLGLVPQDVVWVRSYNGTPVKTNVYRVDIVMNDEIRLDFIEAIEASLPSSDMLLGMNVIGMGDLHIVHPDYKTIDLQFDM